MQWYHGQNFNEGDIVSLISDLLQHVGGPLVVGQMCEVVVKEVYKCVKCVSSVC